MLETLEHFKELIINGVDLLSLVLITPEVLRLLNVWERDTPLMPLVYLAVGALIALIIYPVWMALDFPGPVVSGINLTPMLLTAAVIVVCVVIIYKTRDWFFGERKGGVYIGVLLFALSRLLLLILVSNKLSRG
jgi:hypothetical protein